MNRREMLALMGSAIACKALRAERAAFGRIDAHAHIHRGFPALYEDLEKDDWHVLSICTWEQFDSNPPAKSDVSGFQSIDELHAATAKLHRESRGRIAWAAGIEAHRFEEPDFVERTIAMHQKCFKDGAVGVKVWKTTGMKIRGKDGHYLLPDDAKLQPIYEAIQRADRTLIIHAAEPNEAWAPELVGYWKTNPQWHADKDGPPKEMVLQARDRLVAKNPKLRVMGCHLGSNEQDLPALAKRLEQYPNLSVDICARVRNLFGENQAEKREFVMKYQDRLIYGTDNSTFLMPEDQAAHSPLRAETREWEMFASTGKITQGRGGKGELQGMGLPDSVLRKLFHDNAVRMVPNILKA